MSVSGIGSRSQMSVQSLVDMRRQLDDLQRQLGSGKKAATYAGMGLDRGLTVSLRAQLSALGGFDDAITSVGLRLDFAQATLTRLSEIGRAAKAALMQPAEIRNGGQTAAQENAKVQLDEILELLNTQAGDRSLLAGRNVDRPAVDTAEHILAGDGARAGLKQLIAERNAADLGANGLGRLDIPPAAGTLVSLAENAPGAPFGFKLVSASTTLSGAAIAGPGAPPATISVTLGANPNAGETVAFTLDLPDGSRETVSLTATDAAPPGQGQFTIGANAAATAANLRTALAGAVGQLARTALAAASAVAAADNFFNTGAGQPPLRVAGPPFDTATALVAGTPTNTVTWYVGETGTDPARETAAARIDGSVTVAYGMRADEQGLRWLVQHVAVAAAVTFAPNDPDAPSRYSSLTQRVGAALDYPDGVQRITDIASDLAGVQTTLAAAQERHRLTRSALSGLLDKAEGVSNEEVGAQILALQTRLQASLQTTAMLYQISLINYL